MIAPVSFEVNGAASELDLDVRTTLLDALREHLHLNGTKKGCDQGQCGACTVFVDITGCADGGQEDVEGGPPQSLRGVLNRGEVFLVSEGNEGSRK